MANIKLIHGDCLEEMPKIPDNSVDMILSDPPYGTTRCKWDSVIPLDLMWQELKRVIKPNGAIVMTASQPFTTTLISSNMKMFKYCWIWEKDSGTGWLNANIQPLRNYEDIVIFCKETPTYNPQMRTGFKAYTVKQGDKKTENYGSQKDNVTINEGDRYPLTVIKFNKDKNNLHSTQKPVELLSYLIATYTNAGAMILDFAMGSGSTGIAAVNQKCDFIGIEKDEKYFKIAKNRIDQHAGQRLLF